MIDALLSAHDHLFSLFAFHVRTPRPDYLVEFFQNGSQLSHWSTQIDVMWTLFVSQSTPGRNSVVNCDPIRDQISILTFGYISGQSQVCEWPDDLLESRKSATQLCAGPATPRLGSDKFSCSDVLAGAIPQSATGLDAGRAHPQRRRRRSGGRRAVKCAKANVVAHSA